MVRYWNKVIFSCMIVVFCPALFSSGLQVRNQDYISPSILTPFYRGMATIGAYVSASIKRFFIPSSHVPYVWETNLPPETNLGIEKTIFLLASITKESNIIVILAKINRLYELLEDLIKDYNSLDNSVNEEVKARFAGYIDFISEKIKNLDNYFSEMLPLIKDAGILLEQRSKRIEVSNLKEKTEVPFSINKNIDVAITEKQLPSFEEYKPFLFGYAETKSMFKKFYDASDIKGSAEIYLALNKKRAEAIANHNLSGLLFEGIDDQSNEDELGIISESNSAAKEALEEIYEKLPKTEDFSVLRNNFEDRIERLKNLLPKQQEHQSQENFLTNTL